MKTLNLRALPKKSRYSNAAQIERLIDRARQRYADHMQSACDADSSADALRGTDESAQITKLRASAEGFRQKAKNDERRLITLKNKLATIRTPILPNIEDDGSVSR